MQQYTSYCTQEQTQKALGLGAPIRFCVGMTDIIKEKYFFDGKGNVIIIPTVEQMIGWLEAQEEIKEVKIYSFDEFQNTEYWKYVIRRKGIGYLTEYSFSSRSEATIAAIDAALEYLTNNKNL